MKQVLVVNAALALPAGKMAAQAAHAALGAFLRASRERQAAWLRSGMSKIVVQCDSEAELIAIFAAADEAGLAAFLVRDAGRTVVEAGAATCVGIGPGAAEDIDPITGGFALA